MEAATGTPPAGANDQTPPPEPAPAQPRSERGPITYAVYQASGDDLAHDQIASQLNLIANDVKALNELDARWAAIDGNEELTKAVNEPDGEVFLVAIPERRVGIKRTRLDRKVDERRV